MATNPPPPKKQKLSDTAPSNYNLQLLYDNKLLKEPCCFQDIKILSSSAHQCKTNAHEVVKKDALELDKFLVSPAEVAATVNVTRYFQHITSELATKYPDDNFKMHLDKPLHAPPESSQQRGGRKPSMDLCILRVDNCRTYLIVEVKGSVGASIQQKTVGDDFAQLFAYVHGVSKKASPPPGTEYLGVLTDGTTYHLFQFRVETEKEFPFVITGSGTVVLRVKGENFEKETQELCNFIMTFTESEHAKVF